MKRLSCERTFLLDSTPCAKCGGSGKATHASPRTTPECWDCRGVGRKFTREARELFYEICDLLGAPAPTRESRIRPAHLDVISAGDVAVGMCIAVAGHAPSLVTGVERSPLEQVRLRLLDGFAASLSPLELLKRKLTDDDLDCVDALMQHYIGKGAVRPGQQGLYPPTSPSMYGSGGSRGGR